MENQINNTELFSHKADDYAKFRPSYPDAAVRWLKSQISAESVVDIGAGTGIFTQVLLKYFPNVSAIEPNAQMREKFKNFLPDILCLAASGEATGLADNSVDLITVAQAFHWLDAEKFKKEAMRILKPSGRTAIVWNITLQDEFTEARNRVCQKYCPRFSAGYAGRRSIQAGDIFLREEFFRKAEVVSFNNPFTMDMRTFEGNMRSRSYALAPDDADYLKFTAELRSVFEKYAVDGIVTEPQETQIYFGSF